jgi:hypothetical protein
MKINLDIVNNVRISMQNFITIFSYCRLKKSDKICTLKFTYLDLDICYFCVSQNTKYLNMTFYKFVR